MQLPTTITHNHVILRDISTKEDTTFVNNPKKDKTNSLGRSKEDIYATIGRRKGVTRVGVEELEYDPYESINCKSEVQEEEQSENEIRSEVIIESEICDSSSSQTQSEEDIREAFVPLKSEPRANSILDISDLYSKVKKISSVSDDLNLNSNFVSIYELTKVDSNTDSEPNQTMKTHYKEPEKIKEGNNYRDNISEDLCEPKLQNFALDFSSWRQPVPISALPSDSEQDMSKKEETVSDIKESKLNDWTQCDNQAFINHDPVPKMNRNMFIQKDAKQTVRSWPKVETHTRPKKSEDISPTKQLIGKFNQGLKQPVEQRAPPNKLKSPTKLLINKFNNPSDINKVPTPGGFHGINSITSNNKTGSKFQQINYISSNTSNKRIHAPSKSPVPLPRYNNNTEKNSQVAKLVTALNTTISQQDEEEEANRVSILKRNCGLHGWQAADI